MNPRLKSVLGYYCAHGCNIVFTRYADAEPLTQDYLDSVICKKCGQAWFVRQDVHGGAPARVKREEGRA